MNGQERQPLPTEFDRLFSPRDAVRGSPRLRLRIEPTVSGLNVKNVSATVPSSWNNIASWMKYLLWLIVVGENKIMGGGYNHLDERAIVKVANETVKVLNTRKHTPLRIQCPGVMLLKMLGRLDEVEREQLVGRIQAKQSPEGGFYSRDSESYVLYSKDRPLRQRKVYADMNATLWAVATLAALDARPKDCLAVKEFVYSLQNTDDDYSNKHGRYEFYSHRQDAFREPTLSCGNTYRAVIILRYLGFPIPLIDKLQQKYEEQFDWFMENYDQISQRGKLSHFGHIGFWTYILPVRMQKIRKEICELAWEYLQGLPDDSWEIFKNWATAEIFVPLGRANPRLTFHLSPGQLSFPLIRDDQPKTTSPREHHHRSSSSSLLQQSFVLRITNETILYYADVRPQQLRITDPVLREWFHVRHPDFSSCSLGKDDFVDLPLTIRMTPSALNASKVPLSSRHSTDSPSASSSPPSRESSLPEVLPLEFSLEVPVPGGLGYLFDWDHFLSRIYFTLPIRWE